MVFDHDQPEGQVVDQMVEPSVADQMGQQHEVPMVVLLDEVMVEIHEEILVEPEVQVCIHTH